jgi:8-oxo-dGTP pyrophosphatase MutT (NUDIX family)
MAAGLSCPRSYGSIFLFRGTSHPASPRREHRCAARTAPAGLAGAVARSTEPGGNIETLELPREAALSELREETGITTGIAGLLDTIEIDALDKCGKTRVPAQRILWTVCGRGS